MATVQPPYFASYWPASASIPRTHKDLIPSISTSPWHQSPSDSVSPTGVPSQMYSILNHSPETLDYASSSPTTPYRDSTDDYAGHQSPSLSLGISSFGDLPQQVESSIGPTRGALARKKERLSQANHPTGQRRRGNSAAQLSSSSYFPAVTRPRTPSSTSESNHFQHQATPLSMTHTQSTFQVQSAPPTSRQSADYFSHDGSFHSRSRSTSLTDHRSASPVGSVASARSSMSAQSRSENFFGQAIGSSGIVAAPPRQKGSKGKFPVEKKREMYRIHLAQPSMKQSELADMFGVERSTISKAINKKDEWWTDGPTVPSHKPAKHLDLEEKLKQVLQKSTQPISNRLIETKALEIHQSDPAFRDKPFKASPGWVHNFKDRAGISHGVFAGDARVPDNTHLSPGLDRADDGPLSQFSRDQPQIEEHDKRVWNVIPPPPSSWHNCRIIGQPPPKPKLIHEARQGPNIPTVGEADAAMDIVQFFCCSQDDEYISQPDRNTLQRIKYLIWHTFTSGSAPEDWWQTGCHTCKCTCGKQ